MKSMFKETLDRLGREMRTKKLLNATKRGEAVDVGDNCEVCNSIMIDGKLVHEPGCSWLNAPVGGGLGIIDTGSKKKEKGKNDEPEPPKDYKELKVGDVVTVNGIKMTVRKLTKKDVILRPVKKVIRDEHGLMLSEKEEKAIIESAESNEGGV